MAEMTTGKRKISDNELRERIAHREHQILLAENKRLREALERISDESFRARHALEKKE